MYCSNLQNTKFLFYFNLKIKSREGSQKVTLNGRNSENTSFHDFCVRLGSYVVGR